MKLIISAALLVGVSALADTAAVKSISGDTTGTMLTISGANSDKFFATMEGTQVSPASGRDTRAKASLDACLTHENVELATTYSLCANTFCADSAKNLHCQANNNAICIQRCQAVFPGN